MARDIGWGDEGVGRRGFDKERQYRGVEGETHVVRVMTTCKEIQQHFVDDVLDPDDKGEARGFNQTCSREWNDQSEEYEGDCLGCDREYDTNPKLVAGILHVGTIKGRAKNPTIIDPENAVQVWDFGPDKYRQLREIHFELEREDKQLHQVELKIKCKAGKEKMQDLIVTQWTGDRLTTKAHVSAFKEEGPDLLELFCKAPTIAEQKRNLKKRAPRGKQQSRGDSGRQRRTKDEDRPADDEDRPADDEATGDEGLDDILSEL